MAQNEEYIIEILLDSSLITRSQLERARAEKKPEQTIIEALIAEGILSQFDDLTWWYTRDEEVALTPEIATEVFIEMGDMRSKHFQQMRHETLPPDHLFGRRLETLTLAVMSQLRARGNWHRTAREWIYGDPPTTELGRQEAEFYARAAV